MCEVCIASYVDQKCGAELEAERQAAKSQWFVKEVAAHHHTIPTTIWRPHPTSPEPFYVSVGANTSDAEKIAWIRQDIGDGVELPEFAASEAWLPPSGAAPLWAVQS